MGLARCFSSHKGSVTFLQLGDAFVELSTFWSLFLLFNSMSLSLHTQSRNVSIMTIMMTQTFLIVLNNFWSMIDCRWYSFFFLQRHRDPPWNQSLHAAANQRLALLFICKVISTSLWCHNAFAIISINEFYWQ